MQVEKNLVILKPVHYVDSIHETLWPTAVLLKLFGFIIISKHENADDDNPVFYLKLLSWTTVKAIASQLCVILVCTGVIFISEQSHGNPIAYTLMFSSFYYEIIAVLTTWFRLDPTVKLLNGWKIFENTFRKTFSEKLHLPNLDKEVQKFINIYLRAPVILFVVSGIGQFFGMNPVGLGDTFILFFRLFGFSAMITMALAVKLFYIIICHVMSRIYKAVHEQVLSCILNNNTTKKSALDSKTITKWKTILLIMAEQMRNIGNFISPADSVFIVVRVINLSISVYTILRSFSESYQDLPMDEEHITGSLITVAQVTTMAWVCIVTNLGAAALQVHFAERIYKAHDRIVATLVAFDTLELQNEAKTEFKLLLDFIDRSLCVLLYFGCVKLDRKLLMMVINSTITYLIVLLQFKPL